MYYPEGMKARVSPVQSIEPHRILAPTLDSNQEPPGPESKVVTTILPLTSVWIVKLEKQRSLNRSASDVPGTGFKPETTMLEERLVCVLSSE